MSQRTATGKSDKQIRTITKIGEKEYLLEGQSNWIKFGCQFDTSFITSAQLENGPHLLLGDSFLGEGIISNIENIETATANYVILKISLH